MIEKDEKRNRRIGIATSVGIHAALLIAFLLMMAWRAPNPPYPEYGIELNFGLDNQGFGEVQPETPASSSESVVEDNAEEQQAEETVEPSKEATEDIKPTETQEIAEQPVSKTESPVVVTETKKEKKPAEKVEEKPVETKPKEQVKTEEKLVATYTKPAETVKEGSTNANHGDDPGKVGDKGSKEGSLDAKALYGTQGGGANGTDGLSLQMSGWDWAESPRVPQLPDNDSGRIVFQIECDEQGEITRITTLERGLSPQAEQMLKDMISKNSLIRTSGGKVPEKSVGKFVFVLRSR